VIQAVSTIRGRLSSGSSWRGLGNLGERCGKESRRWMRSVEVAQQPQMRPDRSENSGSHTGTRPSSLPSRAASPTALVLRSADLLGALILRPGSDTDPTHSPTRFREAFPNTSFRRYAAAKAITPSPTPTLPGTAVHGDQRRISYFLTLIILPQCLCSNRHSILCATSRGEACDLASDGNERLPYPNSLGLCPAPNENLGGRVECRSLTLPVSWRPLLNLASLAAQDITGAVHPTGLEMPQPLNRDSPGARMIA
jgi:hypothetical protein